MAVVGVGGVEGGGVVGRGWGEGLLEGGVGGVGGHVHGEGEVVVFLARERPVGEAVWGLGALVGLGVGGC